MAYGTKYYMEWATLNKAARLEIQEDGFGGTATELSAPETPIEIRWGQQGRKDIFQPLMVSDAKLRFRGDNAGEQVKEIFDAGDTEYRVRYELGGSLHWQGFLATDLWRDNPNTTVDVVELDAIDGLALLEANESTVGSEASAISGVLAGLLRGLHDLPLVTSMDWRSNDASLPAGECPLDYYKILEAAHSTNRRQQLEDIAERFLMKVFQAGGRWHLRQVSAYQTGSTDLSRFVMGTGTTTFGTSTTDDVGRALPPKLRTSRPRSRIQRLRTGGSIYNYQELGELAENGSFENGGIGWTFTPGGGVSTRKTFDNVSWNPRDERQENRWGAYIKFEDGDFNSGGESRVFQEMSSISVENPAARFALDFEYAGRNIGFKDSVGFIYISVGSYFLDFRQLGIDVSGTVLKAEDGQVPVTEVPGKDGTVVIPKGAVLPVREDYTGANPPSGTFNEVVEYEQTGQVILSEPARAGDTTLQGQITADIDGDAQGVRVHYWAWDDNNPFMRSTSIPNSPYKTLNNNSQRFYTQKFRVPLHTPQGVTVSGKPSIEFIENDAPDRGTDPANEKLMDKVSVTIKVGDDQISRTQFALQDTHFGRQKVVSHGIGAGPKADHPQRIHRPGTAEILNDWKRSESATYSQRGLEELTAQELMRRQRQTLDRRTYSLKVDDVQSEGRHVTPEYIYTVGGATYFVTYLSRSWGGTDRATLELTEIKDAGVSGLTPVQITDQNAEDSTTAPSVASTAGASGEDIQVELQPNGGLKYDSANLLAVEPADLAGNALEDDGSDNLAVASGGIDTPELADDAVTPPKLDETGAFTVADLTATNELLGEGGVLSKAETGTPAYTAKRKDWQVTKDGRADFRSIYADELVVKKFTSDLTQALGGSDILAKSTTTLAEPLSGISEFGTINQVSDGSGKIDYSASRSLVASSDNSGTIHIYDESLTQQDTISLSGAAGPVFRSGDRFLLYSGTEIYLYDDTFTQQSTINVGETVVSIDARPDGHFAVGTDANNVYVYNDLNTQVDTLTFTDTPSVEFNQSTGGLVVGAGSTLYVHDDSFTQTDSFSFNNVFVFAVRDDGYIAVSTNSSGRIKVVTQNGNLLVSISDPNDVCRTLDWNENDKLVAGSEDGKAYFFGDLFGVKDTDDRGTSNVVAVQWYDGDRALVKDETGLLEAYKLTLPVGMTVNDAPGGKGQAVFEDGDWVLLKYFDNTDGQLLVAEFWGTVSGYTDNGDGTQTWDLDPQTTNLPSGTTIQDGSQVVDYGQSGQGLIRRSTEGSNAPFTITETWTGDPTKGSNYSAHLIEGNLGSAPNLPNGTDPQGWGIYSDNVYLEGEMVVASGFGRVELAADGDPYLLARQDADNLVEVGAGFNRTEMGVTIRAAGNDVLVTDPQGAEIKNLNISGTVNSDLIIDSGKIANAAADWSITNSGFRVESATTDLGVGADRAYTVGNEGVIFGRDTGPGAGVLTVKATGTDELALQTNDAPLTIETLGANPITLGGTPVQIGDFSFGTSGTVIESAGDNSTTLDPGGSSKVQFYCKEDSNGNARLYYYSADDDTEIGPIA